MDHSEMSSKELNSNRQFHKNKNKEKDKEEKGTFYE